MNKILKLKDGSIHPITTEKDFYDLVADKMGPEAVEHIHEMIEEVALLLNEEAMEQKEELEEKYEALKKKYEEVMG